MNKNPYDILQSLVEKCLSFSRRTSQYLYPKPGDVVARCPNEAREKLKDLKSEDIANARVDLYIPYTPEYEDRKNLEEQKMNFDKKLKVLK